MNKIFLSIILFIIYTTVYAVDSITPLNLKKLKNQAASGEVTAELALGNLYFFGKRINKDIYTAFQWYYSAALKGNGPAQFNVALCYDQGLGVETNKLEALTWYQKAAKSGVIQAKFNLAIYYKTGELFTTDTGKVRLKKNIVKSINLLKEISNAGFAPAQRELSKLYFAGTEIKQDHNKAILLLEKAAYSMDAEAMYLLAKEYLQSNKPDMKKIIPLLNFASDNSVPEAQEMLGSLYECGKGLPRNKQMALSLYKNAASKGLVTAQLRLGDCFSNSGSKYFDIQKAKQWYNAAAKQDSYYAIFLLGTYADQGIGEKVNKKIAARNFIKAANGNYPKAQYNLGNFYANGFGVEKDINMAFYWYKKAALQNEPKAQYEVGIYYLKGISVDKNYSLALTWLTASEKNGNSDAANFLKKLRLN